MTTPAAPHGRFRPDIEGLRAVAILTVVLYHLNLFHVSGGFIGVDVFFVISGFLITGLLTSAIEANPRRALPTFYARRIKRLLPAASVTLIATIIAWRIWGIATLPRATATDALYAIFYGLNYRLAHAGTQYFNPQIAPPALQHFWSLAVEEQFYLVWPLLILIVFLLSRRHRRRNLAIALSVIAVGSLYLSWHLSTTAPSWAYFGLHTRAWELATGALVALAAPHLERLEPWLAAPLTWAGLVAIAVATFRFTDRTTYPGLAALVPVLGAALVIAGGCAAPSFGAGLVLNRGPAQVTGRLSYSWYLWHFPIIIIAPFAVGHALGRTSRIGLLFVTFAVAAVSYVVVEQPFRRMQWRPIGWFSLAGASATAVASVAVLAMVFPRPAVGPGPAIAAPHLTGTIQHQESEVRKAVRAAVKATAVPKNLSPNLSHAFGDGAEVDGGCFLGYGGTKVGSCVYGDPHASRTVVMFGDSLIAQWLPVVNQVGKQDGWRVISWGKASCTINDVEITDFQTRQPYRACRTWRDETIQRIRQLNPQAVIAGGFLDYDYPQISASKWAHLTAQTFAELAAPGRALDYMLPDALPSQDMPSCLATHLTNPSACSIPLSSAVVPLDRRTALTKVLGAHGVHVIDPVPLMCSDGVCPPVVGNVPVYRDTTHVTATYAKLMAPLFEGLLPPLTGPTPSPAPRVRPSSPRPSPTTTCPLAPILTTCVP